MEAHEFIKTEKVVNAYSDYSSCGICYLKGIVRSDSGEVLWYLVADYNRLNRLFASDNELMLNRTKVHELRLNPLEYEAFSLLENRGFVQWIMSMTRTVRGIVSYTMIFQVIGLLTATLC